ncbi:hypothetical protein B0T16DRAFT_328979 [Cercophora newfieldiana]|uniref:AAA+ ATPase domain-containing protein n=1 Tax=Cercophora newfieldiana TaxID=92897 RepID=A0AA39Y554_9PEZI|nr:hypothetical protein B0T16DRAFT_328979 [Cercophora newfieldiana]
MQLATLRAWSEAAEAQKKAKAQESDKAQGEPQGESNTEVPPTPQDKTTPAAGPEPVFSKPSLNRVAWDLFTAQAGLPLVNNDIAKSFAIDVLEGDPVIAFRHHNPYLYRGKHGSSHLPKLDDNAPAPKKKVYARGQGPLPERIRINSRHILRILQKLDADKFADGDGGLVMIRPYKALVYYEDQIRKAYQDLKKKFDPSSNSSSKEAAATQKDTTDGEGSKTDNKPAPGEGEEEEEVSDPLTSSKIALEQLGVLIQFLDNDIQGKFDYVRSEQCQRVTFTDVWYLFRPGDEVIDQGRKQVYRVTGVKSSAHKVIPPWKNYSSASAKSDETPIMIDCVYVDFDGKLLGPVWKSVQIPRFEGEKLISSLPVYPLRLVENRKVISGSVHKSFREALIARGKMFVDVLSVKHMNYNGFTLDTRDEVDGQVMVDFEEAFTSEEREATNEKRGNRWRPTIQSLIGAERQETEDIECTAGCCTRERVLKDSYAEKKRNEDYVNSLIPEEPGHEPPVSIYPHAFRDLKASGETLSDAEFIVMSYRVFGFILRSRKWAKFDLTYLEYVNNSAQRGAGSGQESSPPRETAFDQLVMEQNQKNVILSLIAQHFRDKESATAANEQVDIVRGKGKGLIILLHGAPGVGKTTTAEGVAELFARPLFQITCGDLGTSAELVEASLEKHFSLANRWGCILLLDEADVFLAKRTPQDFKRNGLVSVFLRVLEYYAGVLFLTTNRIGDFDEAFGSRIHISLHYPQLTLKATREIFELNLRLIKQRFADGEKKRTLEVEEAQILHSAEKYWNTHTKLRWNGRQIRNACQTALALAEFDAQGGNHMEIMDANAVVKLSVKHLETVSAAYLEFMRYLEKLYKTDQDRLAHKRGYRARELDGLGVGHGAKKASKLDAISSDDSEDGEDGAHHPTPKKDAVAPPSSFSAPFTSPPSSIAPITTSPGPSASPLPRPAVPPEFNGAMPGMANQVPGMMANPALAYMQQAQMWQNMQAMPNMQSMQNMQPAAWQQAMLQGNMPPFFQQPMNPQGPQGPPPGGADPTGGSMGPGGR